MDKSKRIRWARHVAGMGRTTHRTLMGKSERNIPVGRISRGWVDNIKMDHRGTSWDGVDWICLTQDGDQCRALVNAVMNLRVT
jgi:hypothetical protein